jgi:hypothetical protein
MLTKDNHDMYTKPPDGCAKFFTHCYSFFLNIFAPGGLFFFFFFFFFFDSFSHSVPSARAVRTCRVELRREHSVET